MFRNYLLIALRNFKRQKLFTLLNMFGLALGLASAVFIFLYVNDELRYDVIHPNYQSTYRIGATWKNPDGQTFDNIETPGFFVTSLKNNRSEILRSARIMNFGYPASLNNKAGDKIILTEEIRWAEPGFENVLYFDLKQGNKQKMFEDPYTMVLSENGANKLFGKTDPLGKTISFKHFWGTQDREIDVVVTGVYKNYPSNSHFKPDYIINVNCLRKIYGNDFPYFMDGESFDRNRQLGFFENYITLKPGANIKTINAALLPLGEQMVRSDSGFAASGWKIFPFTTRLTDLHFDKKNQWEGNTKGDKTYLTIFGIIAVLIMLIACINYMNLATARSVKRSKEVGLRKTFGSNRTALAKQFFLESFLTTFASLLIAIILVIIFLQPFNTLSHKTFSISSLFNPVMMLIELGIVLFMGFISGIYPSFYLSAFKPIEVLKGQKIKGKSADFFRKSLVTVQYTVALVLIICTFIVIQQMDKLKTTKLNEAGGQLMSIRFGGIADQSKYEIFKQSVLQDPEITHVTMGNHMPRLNYFGWIGATVKFPDFSDKELQWNQLSTDYDFPKTYNLQLIAGRDFENGNPNDSLSLLMNEAAVKALNKSVEKVLGSTVTIANDSGRIYKVIGVVKDFPFRSMHQPIEPLLINPHPDFIDKIVYIKLPVGKFQQKIEAIEKKWKAVYPNTGLDYWFVSDEFNRMYVTEMRVSSLAKAFVLLAIIITILGVFGLASYTAEQKIKEVGIRKVLGANTKQVIAIFSSAFLKIFAVSCIVAFPLAWLAAYKWLEGFVYRISISPIVFFVSLAGLLLITALTISYEIWKSVTANPVTSLRTE